MERIGIVYGPEGGSVENIAKRLGEKLGLQNVEFVQVKNATAGDIKKFNNIIFGISTVGRETWAAEGPANDWDKFLPTLDEIDFSDKRVAMFGLGDSVSYSNHFVDALGTLGSKLIDQNAVIVGKVPTDDYNFEYSKGIFNGQFIGLPIDEDYEPDRTDERLDRWIAQIIPEFI